MSTDRGTMSRGGQPSPDQQSPWVEPTLPAGRRMPSAPRERKPLLVVLALLLIVAGAGAAGLLMTRMSHRVGAIEISRTVPQGQQITAADLAEVQIASDSGVSYVSWSDASVVIKYVAAEEITAGTLLTRFMVSSSNNLFNGRDKVELALKDGQMPADLQPGQTVEVYSTATQANSCQAQTGGAQGQTGGAQSQTGGSVLATTATVVTITASKSGTGVTDVEVAVDPGSVSGVICNAANGTAAVATTSGNG
jgi:hypothetical protein